MWTFYPPCKADFVTGMDNIKRYELRWKSKRKYKEEEREEQSQEVLCTLETEECVCD
jgi:hypothetical protein